jgi:hypothetical protein
MGIGAAILGAGALTAVGGVASGVIGSGAAKDAASIQAAAANNASAATLAMFNTTQGNLAPYMAYGQSALGAYGNALGLPGYDATQAGNTGTKTGSLIAPFNPTISSLEATPGYQFILDQGLKSVQNSYASQGLGSSGAAQKGATNYAEGLAGTTYQQQFSNYLAQNAQTAGILQNAVGSGQNAAAGLGALGLNATNLSNQALLSGAAASAAGTVGSANALTGGIGAVTGAAGNAGLLLALNNQGLFGGPSATSTAVSQAANVSGFYPI